MKNYTIHEKINANYNCKLNNGYGFYELEMSVKFWLNN